MVYQNFVLCSNKQYVMAYDDPVDGSSVKRQPYKSRLSIHVSHIALVTLLQGHLELLLFKIQ